MRDLSLHVLDIIGNSITARATEITLVISVREGDGFLRISIIDNGAGMDEEFLKSVEDPFTTTRTTRKVGLGIPLFKEAAFQSGGNFSIESQKGTGTRISASFGIASIDRLPLGDMSENLPLLILTRPDIRWVMLFENINDEFKFDSFEVIKMLGEVSITDFSVITWIKEYVEEGIKQIFGGVLHEINS